MLLGDFELFIDEKLLNQTVVVLVDSVVVGDDEEGGGTDVSLLELDDVSALDLVVLSKDPEFV